MYSFKCTQITYSPILACYSLSLHDLKHFIIVQFYSIHLDYDIYVHGDPYEGKPTMKQYQKGNTLQYNQ